MKNEKYRNDYCLLQFTGEDHLRPYFNKVHAHEDYVYATNGHIAAKIHKINCAKNYTEVDGYPGIEKIFLQHEKLDSTKASVNELFEELMKLELKISYNEIKCSECRGSGVYKCECCGSDLECTECDGDGKTEGDDLILCSDNNSLVHFFNRKYKIEYFNKIILAAVVTGMHEITIEIPVKEHAGTLFCVGDFQIILMHSL